MTSPPDQTTTRGRSRGRRVESFFALLRRFSRLWGFALFLVFTVYLFREVVVPFIFAFALAYLLSPIIKRMAPRIGRAAAVVVVYLGVFAFVGGFVGVLLPALIQDFARLRDSAPEIVTYVDDNLVPRATEWLELSFGSLDDATREVAVEAGAIEGVREAIGEPLANQPPPELIAVQRPDGSWQISLEAVRLHIEETGRGSWTIEAPSAEAGTLSDTLRKLVATKGSEYTGMIAEGLRALVSGVTAFLTKFIITLMLAAFILVDPGRINTFIRSLIPPVYRDDFDEILGRIDVGLSGVIRGQLLICLVNAILTWIGLMIVGVKYSFLLALSAGLFSLIPIFGTIISSIPIMVVAMVSGEDGVAIGPPLLMLAWISGIHLLEANVLNPKIIGDSAHMHPVIIIFALLAGENLYGLTGALLAVPVANVVQILYLFALRRSEVYQRGDAPDVSAVATFDGDDPGDSI
ncbi:MAG: AI-2E family transporter [Myxococcales bacterium]|nr:AI-2E family transporter [Myxococcales bacterium]MCB9569738.1 AI-2E family transporter [Myxococcales bacterium]MCB9701691.1 AI-2E family transporter [Myxococcales bacterium]